MMLRLIFCLCEDTSIKSITLSRFCLVVLLLLTAGAARQASANDDIFPPADAAKSSIDFDGRGFLIHGKRTFLASGSLHFARCPRALWRDRLLRMKRMGLNTVQTYIFWNWHEAKEGQWDFTGDHDLNAYLKLVHELGMYATVRLGPYDCAEWDSGGYPVWLRFKPGVRVREDNPQFLHYVDKLYDKIVPIVAANQINHGGSVILVQCENEYAPGWGTEGNSYEQHLRNKALALGIEVPTFFSGLHHGSDPAGETPWGSIGRTSPWHSTEFWTTWYSAYGQISDRQLNGFDRGTWKIIAFGGNGYNYYMAYGGTNFGTYNNNEDASSYDYGAAIGQAGDLRPLYYRFKRAAWFARSFQDVLEDSVNSSSQFQNLGVAPAVRVLARTSPAGSIVFLDNNSGASVQTQIKDAQGVAQPALGPVTLAKGQILPILEHYKLTPQFTIDQSVSPILGAIKNGSNTTLILYGPPNARGATGAIELSSPSLITSLDNVVQSDGHHVILTFRYRESVSGPERTLLNAGGEHLQLLIMNDDAADHTWSVDVAGKTYIVTGPDYVGDADMTNGVFHVQAEFKDSKSIHTPVVVYAPDLTTTTLQPAATEPIAALPGPPTLTDWKQSVTREQSPSYDTDTWLTSPKPLPMGADGDPGAYAWYKTTVTAKQPGMYHLHPTTLRDRMIVFVDGKRAANADGVLDLSQGDHKIAILTTHYGRDKLYNILGPIDTIDAKGLSGDVYLTNAPNLNLTAWKMLPVVQDKPDVSSVPASDAANWQSVVLGTDPFNNQRGWAWYQTVIAASDAADGAQVPLKFDNVDDNATVFCNGQNVGSHQGWGQPFTIDLKSAWHPHQQNVVTVLDENTGGGGGITGVVTLAFLNPDSAVMGWKIRGGVGEPSDVTNWTPLVANATDTAPPMWFQAQFMALKPMIDGPHPILRVHLGNLSAGFVWLNGHNLGRYPEKIAVDGLYLPECWILPGANTLTIFDEDGHQPTDVRLVNEQAASRFALRFSAKVGK